MTVLLHGIVMGCLFLMMYDTIKSYVGITKLENEIHELRRKENQNNGI